VGRACIHRGSSGTRESQMSPCSGIRIGKGRRKGKFPAFGEKLQLPGRASKKGHEQRGVL
jgi:hypothetical protein